jgi:hypothetical protein
MWWKRSSACSEHSNDGTQEIDAEVVHSQLVIAADCVVSLELQPH